jgi:hypothetical protein
MMWAFENTRSEGEGYLDSDESPLAYNNKSVAPVTCAGGGSVLGLNCHRQIHIEGVAVRVAEVGERLRLLLVVLHRKRPQRLHRNHPRRNGGPQILGQK